MKPLPGPSLETRLHLWLDSLEAAHPVLGRVLLYAGTAVILAALYLGGYLMELGLTR